MPPRLRLKNKGDGLMRSPLRLRASGFTLVELMVTIAVLSIGLAAATPSFVDFIDKARVRGAADGVVDMIGQTRAEAVKLDRNISIAFKGSGTAWCVGANSAAEPTGGNPVLGATACDCTVATACYVAGQRSVIDGSASNGVSLAALPADFAIDSKLGVISPLSTRAITLTSPKGKYDLTVQINALGQARLCRPGTKPTISGIATC